MSAKQSTFQTTIIHWLPIHPKSISMVKRSKRPVVTYHSGVLERS